MGDKKRIALSPLGLREADLRLLKAISALSGARDRPYSFFVTEEPVALPTIWLVDADSIAHWQEQYKAEGAVGVIIAASADNGGDEPVVQRPITASRFLAALDLVAEKELVKQNQLVIGDTSGPANEELARSGSQGVAYSRYAALVVDDSPTIQKQIELGLRLIGVNAVCVGTGEEALETLKESRFDLIFLDVVLPGADGYQVCKSIKRDPANKKTPVIMLTSKSSTFDRVRGSMVGCDTYLTKPVDTETFNKVVAKYLHTDEQSTR